MNKKLLILSIFCAFTLKGAAQLTSITARNQGKLYLMAGYDRAWFSKSDIQFHGFYPESPLVPSEARGQEYDFTLQNAKAVDNPEINSIGDWNIASPQFNLKLGYIFHGEYINGIELGFHHFIYSMKPDQRLRVVGQVYDSASQGVVTVKKEMMVTDKLARFSHASGTNYLMLSFVRGMWLLRTRTEMHTISCLVKPGAGIVIPRSEISVNGTRQEDNFHIGGYVAGLEVSFRYVIAESVFLETAGKGSYANFSKVLATEGISSHHTFTSFEWLLSLGYQFRL